MLFKAKRDKQLLISTHSEYGLKLSSIHVGGKLLVNNKIPSCANVAATAAAAAAATAADGT